MMHVSVAEMSFDSSIGRPYDFTHSMATIKSFKKLTLDKNTVLPAGLPLGGPSTDSLRKTGAQSASEYCSGMSACSTFYSCAY